MKGLFVGDGYKYHDKKYRKYYVEFYLNSIKDREIIIFLTSLLKKLELNIYYYKDKRFNCIRLRVINKEFFKVFDKNVANININNEEFLGFVSGIIDSEGYVNIKKNLIEVVNTDFKLIEFLSKKLKRFRINSSISKKSPSERDKMPSYRLWISVNFKRLKHLSIKAGKLS